MPFSPSPLDSVHDLVAANGSHADQRPPVFRRRMSVTPVPGAGSVAVRVRPTDVEPVYAAPALTETLPVGLTVSRANVAVADLAASIVTLQTASEPAQSPLQPVNVELEAGAAVSWTDAPGVNPSWQVAPQSMPSGALLTEPEPVPSLETVRSCAEK